VCFSAANGHNGFPAQMPSVIAVGGVYLHEDLAGGDFKLEASDYASSFDSVIYPGRHVPDVRGLVGMKPRAIYIMLPVQPGDDIDQGLAGAPFPDKHETAPGDGWAVISGTTAASPQIAGVCALLKQVQPGLSPALIKNILRAFARDVKVGTSNTVYGQSQPAGEGHDGATGAGLVDAAVAYELARSVTPRNRFTVPSPLLGVEQKGADLSVDTPIFSKDRPAPFIPLIILSRRCGLRRRHTGRQIRMSHPIQAGSDRKHRRYHHRRHPAARRCPSVGPG
jgi:serine protease AprX